MKKLVIGLLLAPTLALAQYSGTSGGHYREISFDSLASVSAPGSGHGKIFSKGRGGLYYKTAAGTTRIDSGFGGSGASMTRQAIIDSLNAGSVLATNTWSFDGAVDFTYTTTVAADHGIYFLTGGGGGGPYQAQLMFSGGGNPVLVLPSVSGTLTTGSGTANYLPYWSGTNQLGNSPYYTRASTGDLVLISPDGPRSGRFVVRHYATLDSAYIGVDGSGNMVLYDVNNGEVQLGDLIGGGGAGGDSTFRWGITGGAFVEDTLLFRTKPLLTWYRSGDTLWATPDTTNYIATHTWVGNNYIGQSLPQNRIFIGGDDALAVAVPVTGDITMTWNNDTAVTAIGTGKVTPTMLQNQTGPGFLGRITGTSGAVSWLTGNDRLTAVGTIDTAHGGTGATTRAGGFNALAPPSNRTSGYAIVWNGSAYVNQAVAGSGTVTNVGLSMPSIFSVIGSPVTSADTFEVSLVSQTANRVFASPASSSGLPTFRSLVSADIPGSYWDTTRIKLELGKKVDTLAAPRFDTAGASTYGNNNVVTWDTSASNRVQKLKPNFKWYVSGQSAVRDTLRLIAGAGISLVQSGYTVTITATSADSARASHFADTTRGGAVRAAVSDSVRGKLGQNTLLPSIADTNTTGSTAKLYFLNGKIYTGSDASGSAMTGQAILDSLNNAARTFNKVTTFSRYVITDTLAPASMDVDDSTHLVIRGGHSTTTQNAWIQVKGGTNDNQEGVGGTVYVEGGGGNADDLDTTYMGNVIIQQYTTSQTGRGRVGIGTKSPGSKLDVVGTVTATNFSGAGTSLTGVVKPGDTTYGTAGNLMSQYRSTLLSTTFVIDSTALSTYSTAFNRGWFRMSVDSCVVDSVHGVMMARATGDTVSVRVLWGTDRSSPTDSTADLKVYNATTGNSIGTTKVIPPKNWVWIKVTEKDGTPRDTEVFLSGRRKW